MMHERESARGVHPMQPGDDQEQGRSLNWQYFTPTARGTAKRYVLTFDPPVSLICSLFDAFK